VKLKLHALAPSNAKLELLDAVRYQGGPWEGDNGLKKGALTSAFFFIVGATGDHKEGLALSGNGDSGAPHEHTARDEQR